VINFGHQAFKINDLFQFQQKYFLVVEIRLVADLTIKNI